MGHVEHEPIDGRIENPVQADRQLDDPEIEKAPTWPPLAEVTAMISSRSSCASKEAAPARAL